jgi:hypothetical protein
VIAERRANTMLYVVKKEADRWVFVPTSIFVRFMVGIYAATSLFVFYLSTIFIPRAGTASASLWIGAIFFLLASWIAGMGIRAWRERRTPLIVELGGRVSYGERELCAAGTVRAVRIAPARGGEADDCDIFLQQAGGNLVSIPSRYFGGFSAGRLARPFAAQLAEALGVQVAESN